MINIVTYIKSLNREKKLPHAILIIDENKNNGYRLAKSIAFLLLCDKKTQSKICKKCISCLAFSKGKHPDYHELYSDHEIIKLDNLKNFLAYLSYKPTIAKNKVVLLYTINLFSDKASNTILKILEEPPENTIFLLISHKQYILSTIKDRCQVFSIQCKSKFKSSKIIRFLYNYLVFDKNEKLSNFIDKIEKNDEEMILDSIYVFILHYLKNINIKNNSFYNKNIDKMKLFNVLTMLSQTKCLITNHFNPRSKYSIEDTLKLLKIYYSSL